MGIQDKLLEITKRFSFLELPIGVYIVTVDGQIVEANKQAREMLQLPLEGHIEKSILDFYQDQSDREGLPKALEEKEKAGEYLDSKLTFNIGNQEHHIQDLARSITDPDTNKTIGYLCCMMDVTSDVRYRKMFEELPIGVYMLDRNDRIVQVNEAFATLFGYESPEELHGIPVQEMYADPEDALEFRQLLELHGSRSDHIVQLVKKNGETIFVRVSAIKNTSPSGEYDGREGTVMDAAKERYRRILDVAPIGLYEIQRKDGQERIVHCNDQFMEITEFDNKRQAKNYDVEKLHSSTNEYQQFLKELDESSSIGKPLVDREIKIRTFKGNEKAVRVSVRSTVHGRSKQNTGRIGVVRDVTELRHKVEELTDDIGNVLHSYSAALVEITQSVDSLLETMRLSPSDAVIGQQPERFIKELETPTKQMAQKLIQLLSFANIPERQTPSLMEQFDDLVRLTNLFDNLEKEVPYLEHRPSALHEATSEVMKICEELKGERLPNQLIRQIKTQGQELLRALNLLTLYNLRDLAFAMGQPVRSLREFVITGVRVTEPKTVMEVPVLVNRALENVTGFARIRGISIRHKIECRDALVEVRERDIVRALANILQNAIKYSWTRSDNSLPWITIRVRLINNMVHFEFENYGVPIPKDEIERKLIFELGFRGRMSSDRKRVGTGVGLADALRVAQQHGGDVTAKSHPASPGKREDNYNQPFLTTITLIIPVHLKKGVRNEA